MCFRDSIHKLFEASALMSGTSQSGGRQSTAVFGSANGIDGNKDDDDMNDEERVIADDIQNTLRLQQYIRGVGILHSNDAYAPPSMSRPSTSGANHPDWE